ncbi:hypothetical protein BH10PSE17_BH10PSE17_26890 [soil metagenome]
MESQSSVVSVSGEGISGDHPLSETNPARIAPTTEESFNALRRSIGPVACWRVEDACFEFDSSFVVPEIAGELTHLSRLRKRLPGRPLSVFGHADPVGKDDYNKTLSGRRAIAIYALLTRRVDLWEKLFAEPFGDDKWSKKTLLVMASAVAAPPAPEEPMSDEEKAITLFEDSDRGPGCLIFAVRRGSEPAPAVESAPAGDPAERANAAAKDPGARSLLYRDYMDRLCGPDLLVDASEFLGKGADPDGKADYQGCGEFNPILLFSLVEQKRFAPERKKEERDLENSPNRRVLVFLFREGATIDPGAWPCPKAKEGPAGCRKRFWSDAEARRSNQDVRREFSKTRDTFACRFYHRVAVASPCETGAPPVRIRLYDTAGRFIPNAPYRFSIGTAPTREGFASAKGIITVRATSASSQGFIEWGLAPPDGQEANLRFAEEVFLGFPDDREQRADRKLQNLGYGGTSAPLPTRTEAFQRDYAGEFGLSVTGLLDAKTSAAIDDVHDSMQDRLKDHAA